MRQTAAKTNKWFKEAVSCDHSFLIFIAPKHWSFIKLLCSCVVFLTLNKLISNMLLTIDSSWPAEFTTFEKHKIESFQMVSSICTGWELSKASTANFTARLRWERYQDDNQNSVIFKVLETNSLSEQERLAHAFCYSYAT